MSRPKSFFVLSVFIAGLVVSPSSVLAQLRHGKRPPQAKIVGGTDAKITYWPGQVALKLQDPDDAQSLFFCGGTAIAPQWVLTAAHCFDEFNHRGRKSIFARKGFRVETKAGIVDVSGWRLEVLGGTDNLASRKASRIRQVEKVIVHPDYDRATMLETGNDITLVRLSSPFPQPQAVLSLKTLTQ